MEEQYLARLIIWKPRCKSGPRNQLCCRLCRLEESRALRWMFRCAQHDIKTLNMTGALKLDSSLTLRFAQGLAQHDNGCHPERSEGSSDERFPVPVAALDPSPSAQDDSE